MPNDTCSAIGGGVSRGRRLEPAAYAVRFAAQPAHRLNDHGPVRSLRDAMKHANVGSSARAHVWRVLSAVLSWAAHSDLVPEIQTHACLVANENVSSRRKSMRGRSGRVSVRRRGEEIRSWALAPIAVESIKAQMLARAVSAREPLLAFRDAAVVSLSFGLGLRPQEAFGVRWCALDGARVFIDEVISQDGLQSLGKTPGSMSRPVKAPAVMRDDLARWRECLREHGHPARDIDFCHSGQPRRLKLRRMRRRDGRVASEPQPDQKVGAPLPHASCRGCREQQRLVSPTAWRYSVWAQARRDLHEIALRRRAVCGSPVWD